MEEVSGLLLLKILSNFDCTSSSVSFIITPEEEFLAIQKFYLYQNYRKA